MTETSATQPDAQEAIGNVIRSFTDAELALRELLAAAEHFRSASDDLAAGRLELELTRSAFVETADSLIPLVAGMTASSEQLQQTAAALRAVDQDRIWTEFEAVAAAQDAAETEASARTRELAEAIAISTAALRAGITAATAEGIAATSASTERMTSAIEAATERTASWVSSVSEASTTATSTTIQAATSTLEERLGIVDANLTEASTTLEYRIGESHDALAVGMAASTADLTARLDQLSKRADYILVIAVAGAILAGVAAVGGFLT